MKKRIGALHPVNGFHLCMKVCVHVWGKKVEAHTAEYTILLVFCKYNKDILCQ